MRRRRKTKTGPEPKLANLAVREKLLAAIRGGAPRRAAAALVGICDQTIRNERDRDQEFNRLITEADAEAQVNAALRITRAGETDWRALAFWLERRHPNEWARRDPDSIAPDKLASVIGRLVAALITKVPAEHHEELMRSIQEMITGLTPNDRNENR